MHASLKSASVLGLALVVGCTTPAYQKAETASNSLGDVKTELTTDKVQLKAAVDNLNDLVYRPQSDLRPQYEKYAKSVDALEKSAASSRASARNLTTNREAYLSKWRSDTASIKDADLRLRAMDRIGDTEKNFAMLGEKLIEADNALAPLVGKLRALQIYLGGDLTANGIKLVTDRATDAKNNIETVNPKIDTAIVELDKVSDEIAPMPTTQPSGM